MYLIFSEIYEINSHNCKERKGRVAKYGDPYSEFVLCF